MKFPYGVELGIAESFEQSLHEHVSYVREAGQMIGVSKHLLYIHDNSKWTEEEFPGYAKHFKGGGAPDEFSKAWLHHIHYNPHHWQHWIFSDGFTPKNSSIENGIIEMPYEYTLEMVADWMGASRAYTGSWDMADWLDKNISKIRVHSKTAGLLRGILDNLGYADIVNMKEFSK